MNDLTGLWLTKKTKPLNEANITNKYALSNDILNGVVTEDDRTDDLTDKEFDESNPEIAPDTTEVPEVPETDKTTDTPEELPTADQEVPDVDETGADPTRVNNDIDVEDTNEFSSDETDSTDDAMSDEIVADAQATPGIRILSTITDDQYNLLNDNLRGKFFDLIKEEQRMLESDIDKIVNTDPRTVQVKDIVTDNINNMIKMIRDHLETTYSTSYEQNAVAYGCFKKQQLAQAKIIDKLIKGKLR